MIKYYEVRLCRMTLIILTVTDQECDGVKDKLNDLIPWLEKLLENLAKVNPDDNHEVER